VLVIEERLKAVMKIPVFHDDQHGTPSSPRRAENALEVAARHRRRQDRHLRRRRRPMACLRLYIRWDCAKRVILTDSKGVIYKGRTIDMTRTKRSLAAENDAANSHRGARRRGRVVGLPLAHRQGRT